MAFVILSGVAIISVCGRISFGHRLAALRVVTGHFVSCHLHFFPAFFLPPLVFFLCGLKNRNR